MVFTSLSGEKKIYLKKARLFQKPIYLLALLKFLG